MKIHLAAFGIASVVANAAYVSPSNAHVSDLFMAHDAATPAEQSTHTGQVVTGTYTGTSGTRPWRLYIPGAQSAGKPLPMIVMLHGCTQNAADIARGTRLDQVAEVEGMLVLYPEQVPTSNPRGCWNWYDPANQLRGAGEPAIIADMTAQLAAQYKVDASRIYIAGVSAGAGMATLTAAAYPERFAAVASASGVAWRAATTVTDALQVMQKGAGGANTKGTAAFAAMGDNARVMPVLIIHGAHDAVVAPANGDESAIQWVTTNNATLQSLDKPDLIKDAGGEATVDGEYHVSVTRWTNSAGQGIVELYTVAELGHAWSGGSTEGTFADAKGPNATQMMVKFFKRHSRSGTH